MELTGHPGIRILLAPSAWSGWANPPEAEVVAEAEADAVVGEAEAVEDELRHLDAAAELGGDLALLHGAASQLSLGSRPADKFGRRSEYAVIPAWKESEAFPYVCLRVPTGAEPREDDRDAAADCSIAAP